MPTNRIFLNKNTVQITIRLPEPIMERVKEEAVKERRSLNQMLISLIQEGLDVLEKKQS
jgi:predicted DNA binding CopG/RHH family protein